MSKKLKLTPWFRDGQKPARRGVYQQRNPFGVIGYQRWDGERWYGWCRTAEAAAIHGNPVAEFYSRDPWRGLAANPVLAGRT